MRLGLPCTSLILTLTSMLWSIDTCQNKVSADQYHVTTPRTQVHSWFSIGSRAHVRLNCWKQGSVVRKAVNASPGLKFIRIITFSSIHMFFAALFWVYGDYKTQTESQTVNRTPHRKVRKLKSHYTFSWVSSIRHWTTRPRSYAFSLA